jgi:prophage regulatory protein
MGAHEIRIRLGGISRQRVYQLTSRADFPAPVADLAQGKIWRADDVEAWITARRHQAGGAGAENPIRAGQAA